MVFCDQIMVDKKNKIGADNNDLISYLVNFSAQLCFLSDALA